MMKLLIDCDPGIDDALALCDALFREEIEIVGISTVAGNTSAMQGAENVLRLLKLTGREGKLPVCCGAERPLYGPAEKYPVKIHGENGLANVELLAPSQQPVPMDVCEFLYDAACRCNETLTLVGLDVTMKTILSRKNIESFSLRENNPEMGRFLTEILSFQADLIHSKNPGMNGCPLHDPLAMLAAADPSLVRTERIPVRVDCTSTPTRGKILPGSGNPVNVCVAVENEKAIRRMLRDLLT